ncbi:hypothetical protein MPER_05274 [Moniliophthora perniciosa FA553]|nr:hypothetical protein MPER_05274 [Moniliophthora perniciosa FA553]
MAQIATRVKTKALINGANLFWLKQFGVGSNSERDVWIQGLVNSAPYFGCALFACWTTDPLNHYFGRKGTILVTLVFATFPCIWAACTNSWQNLFASRVILSMGIGPKSSGKCGLRLESPRWLLLKNRPRDAYKSLLQLRHTPVQAARDLFYISVALEAEKALPSGNKYKDLFTKPRVRRATLGSFIVMFMQQFCGINVIATSRAYR